MSRFDAWAPQTVREARRKADRTTEGRFVESGSGPRLDTQFGRWRFQLAFEIGERIGDGGERADRVVLDLDDIEQVKALETRCREFRLAAERGENSIPRSTAAP